MLLLSLLFANIACSRYPKSICACTTCNTSEVDCIGAISINPILTTFYEDFDTARENNRNIKLIFNEITPDTVFTFNLSMFTNLIVTFVSHSSYTPLIVLTYEDGKDYSNSNLTFKDIRVQFEDTDSKTPSSKLVLGYFKDCSGSDYYMKFLMKGDKKNLVKIESKTFDADITSLINCSSVTISEIYDHSFYVHSLAPVSLVVDVASISLKVAECLISFNYISSNIISFIGEDTSVYDQHHSKLTCTFNSVKTDLTPHIYFKSITTVELLGQKPEGILELYEILNIVSNGPVFPFTITADNTNLQVTENLIFKGILRNSRFISCPVPNLTISTSDSIKSRCQVSFPNILTAIVSIVSPLLNVEIERLNASFITKTTVEFPVKGCISESESSLVTIKRINYGANVGIIYKFGVYTDISKQYSSEEIKKLAIAKGLQILSFPSENIIKADGAAIISLYSKTFFNQIHGFSYYVNNLNITQKTIDGKIAIYVKTNPDVNIYDFPRHVCIGTQCSSEPNGLIPSNFLNITDPKDYADFSNSKIFINGVKNYFIMIQSDSTIGIGTIKNIDPKSINIIFEGLESAKSIDFKGTNLSCINSTKLVNIKITSKINFSIPYLLLGDNTLFNSNTVTYGEETVLIMDPERFKSTYEKATTAVLYKLVLDITNYIGIEVSGNQYRFVYNKNELETGNYRIFFSKFKNVKSVDVIAPPSIYFLADPFISEKKSVYGINIVFNQDSKMEIRGNTNKIAKMSPKLSISYGDYDLDVTYTEPKQGINFDWKGDSSPSTIINYGKDFTKVCIEGSETCKADVYDLIYKGLNISKAIDELKSKFTNPFKLKFTLAISESEISTILFSYTDCKEIHITPQGSKDNRNIELDFDVTEVDRKFSSLKITNNNLTTNLQEDKEIYFGTFHFSPFPYLSEEFQTHVKAYFQHLVTLYELLPMFKELHITDQISVNYLYTTVPFEDDVLVYIGLDNDAHDIMATELGNSTIRVGRDYIKIGKLNFSVPKSSYYDAYFGFHPIDLFVGHYDPESLKHINITFQIDDDVDVAHMPKMTIDTTQMITSEIHLEGNWDGYNETVIQLITDKKTDIYLNDDMVPLEVIGGSENVVFHLSSDENGVYGPLYGSGSAFEVDIDEKYTTNNNVTFRIQNGLVFQDLYSISKPIFKVKRTNIQATIEGAIVIDQKKAKFNNAYLTMHSTIDKVQTSQIDIKTDLGAGVIFTPYIYVQSYITGKLENEDTFDFIKKSFPIIKARQNDMAHINNIQLSYLDDGAITNRTHGFFTTMNCLEVFLDVSKTNDASTIYLKSVKKPSEVPFSIDYSPSGLKHDDEGELVITKDNLDDLKDIGKFLPNKVNAISFRVIEDMTIELPFIIKKYISSLVSFDIKGTQLLKPKTFVELPSDGDLNITFYNLILLSSKKGAELQAKFLSLENIEFEPDHSFVISSKKIAEMESDVDSIGTMIDASLIAGQFTNPTTISSGNFITFTKDGWKMRELYFFQPIELKSSIFTNLIVKTSRALELQVDSPDMTSIHGLNIIASKMLGLSKVQVQFGLHWNNIKETGGTIIKVCDNEVDAGMASYPVPYIFDCDKSKVNFFYNQDSDAHFDLITIETDKIENNVVKYNFTNLDPKFQVLNAPKLDISGVSAIEFANNEGTVRCGDVTIQTGASMTFPNVSIGSSLEINKGSKVSGQFSFNQSSTLNMHWTMESLPSLAFTPLASSLPRSLNIIFDEKTADKNDVNQKMFQSHDYHLIKGVFNCSDFYNDKITFTSDYKYFNSGDDNVLQVLCEYDDGDAILMISAAKKIENKLSTGAIVGIVIACVAVVAIVVGVSVYCNMRKKYDALLSTVPMEMEDTANKHYIT